MIIFLQATAEGLALGAVYSLVAIGFVLMNIDIVVQKPKGLFIGLDVRILWAHQWSSSEYHRRVIQTHESPHNVRALCGHQLLCG